MNRSGLRDSAATKQRKSEAQTRRWNRAHAADPGWEERKAEIQRKSKAKYRKGRPEMWGLWRERHTKTYILGCARSRAKRKGILFAITEDDFEIPIASPVLGIPLQYGEGRGHKLGNSPSLDRIRNELGYVRGNVIVVSDRANTLKRDATPDELRKLADFYGALTATP